MHYNESKRDYVAKKTILLEEQSGEFYSGIMLNVYSAMKEKGISFAELSCITGISESHLYRVLRGNSQVKLDSFCRIMVALDIEPQEIFPKAMQKRQEKTEYGECFEYIVRNMDDMEKDFLLDWTEQYAMHQEQRKEVRFVPHDMNAASSRGEGHD